jgi:hypothetical protein
LAVLRQLKNKQLRNEILTTVPDGYVNDATCELLSLVGESFLPLSPHMHLPRMHTVAANMYKEMAFDTAYFR